MAVTVASSAEGGQAPKLAARGVAPLWAAHSNWRRLFRRLHEISDWRINAAAAALFLGVIALSAGMKSRLVFGGETTGANVRTGGHGVRGAPEWTFYVESGVSRYLPILG